jgi:hypothetical protein
MNRRNRYLISSFSHSKEGKKDLGRRNGLVYLAHIIFSERIVSLPAFMFPIFYYNTLLKGPYLGSEEQDGWMDSLACMN